METKGDYPPQCPDLQTSLDEIVGAVGGWQVGLAIGIPEDRAQSFKCRFPGRLLITPRLPHWIAFIEGSVVTEDLLARLPVPYYT